MCRGWGRIVVLFILYLRTVCSAMATIKSRLWTPDEAPEDKEANDQLFTAGLVGFGRGGRA